MPDAVREDEIASILARLREEVRRAPAGSADGPASAPPIRLTARQEAERLWPVSADRPLQRRAGAIELILGPIRLVLRKAMRWYVEPAFADQREFNGLTLELIDDLAARTSAGLTRLERALPQAPEPSDSGPYASDLRGAAPLLSCDNPDELAGIGEGTLGGVLVHAPDGPPSEAALNDLLAAAFLALRRGGVLVVEAGGSVDAEAAAGQARKAGFERVDVRFAAGPHGYALVVRK
jgi:hypothetical protein